MGGLLITLSHSPPMLCILTRLGLFGELIRPATMASVVSTRWWLNHLQGASRHGSSLRPNSEYTLPTRGELVVHLISDDAGLVDDA